MEYTSSSIELLRPLQTPPHSFTPDKLVAHRHFTKSPSSSTTEVRCLQLSVNKYKIIKTRTPIFKLV